MHFVLCFQCFLYYIPRFPAMICIQLKFTSKIHFLCVFATTNLAACVCVCVCAKFDQFLPERSHFDSKRPENSVRIATFPSATFGPLFAFHCHLFIFTKNNNLEWESSRFATRDVFDLNAGVLPQMSPPLYGGGDISR